MNGKGSRPCMGYNWQKWEENFGNINWKPKKGKKKNETGNQKHIRRPSV